MGKKEIKKALKKAWIFVVEDDSAASWIVNVLLAFIIIKFMVYPILGLVFSTSHPIVAVISGSMEHKIASSPGDNYLLCGEVFEDSRNVDFDDYWKICGNWYAINTNITSNQFQSFIYSNGFNTGDIMVLRGNSAKDINVGDVIVFRTNFAEPIIHRVVKKTLENSNYYFQTKGDHNRGSNSNELKIGESQIIGKVVFRVPYLGWVKIGFVKLLAFMGV